MGEYHSLLRRQLKRVFGDADATLPELEGLLAAVDEAYHEFDADRALLERSLDLSSQELLQANAEMVALFRAVPDRFYRLDKDGFVLDYRGGTGALPEEAFGRRFGELLPAAAAPDFEGAVARVRAGDSMAGFEYVDARATGEASCEARIVPLADAQVVVIVRDITDRRRAETQVAALARVGRELATTLDLSRAANHIVQAVVKLFQARSSALYRLDPASGALICVASAGASDPTRWVGTLLPRGAGVAGQAVILRRIVASADILEDPDVVVPELLRSHALKDSIRSAMAAPLVSQGRVIGALALADVRGREYRPEERRFLAGLGDQAALAIENARLFEESDRRRRNAEGVAEVGRLVTASLEPAEVGEQVVRALYRLLPSRIVVFYRVDPGSGEFVSVAGVGPETGWSKRLPADAAGTVGQAIYARAPVVTRDVLEDPTLRVSDDTRERLTRSGFRAVLAVPLIAHDRVLGGLVVGDERGRVFDEEEIRLAQTFAAQASLALANAQLYEQMRTRLERMRRFADLSQIVSSSLDLKQVLDSVGSAALDLLHCDLTRLWVLDRATGKVKVAAACATDGLVPSEVYETELALGEGLTGWVIAEKTRHYSARLTEDPLQKHKDWVRRFGYASQLAVPLVAGGEAVGALTILSRTERRFTEEEVELADVFAAQAATAIANAHLYREARDAFDRLSRAQELLVNSQKMEAIGRLAGGIAHDFNNLLTIISGRTEVLLEDLEGDAARCRDVEIIAGAANRAAALTRQLLAFSRRQMLERRTVDTNVIVTGVVKMLRRLIGENIELTTEVASEPVCVKADPGQLEQIIMNLAVNARDAMPDGGRLAIRTMPVTLTAETQAADGPMAVGRWVALAVQDSGHGIDAEVRPHIFEPFFTTKEIGRGTGLGLATVYGIVQQHEGHITLDSGAGRGSTFTIFLPRVDELPPVRPARREGTPTGTETILLVEDEPLVRAFAREILEAQGYQVLEAGGGHDAVQLATTASGPIHLLVTDLVMPGLSGRAVAAAILRLHPALRTLFISGYTDDIVGHVSELESDTNTFLEKPFTGQVLARKVRELLDRP
ncbi:MAG: GAF domain-containing protein [Candidatus Rokubacteria bacterium]|nr:GAF domain-containing protein [Candidatus Rokubacteria bacterium]